MSQHTRYSFRYTFVLVNPNFWGVECAQQATVSITALLSRLHEVVCCLGGGGWGGGVGERARAGAEPDAAQQNRDKN
jgi:hypothetical protein